jgi:hypothetical protein
MMPNDEVERRGAALTQNETDLSPSSIPSLVHRRLDPRSLEPIVRRDHRYSPLTTLPTLRILGECGNKEACRADKGYGCHQ